MEDWKKRKILNAAVVLMAMVTVIYGIYVGAVVYANSNPSDITSDIIVITAFEFRGQPPSPPWLTPEELGFVVVREHLGWLEIAVQRERGHQLHADLPIFIYKDKFYQISRWATEGLSDEGVTLSQILLNGGLGAGLATGWIIFGAMYRRERKTMMRRMTDNWMSEK